MTSGVIDPARRWRDSGGEPTKEPSPMTFDILPLAIGLLIGIAAVGSCIGIGLAGSKMLESTARQPELKETLQTLFFLIPGVTDAAFIIPTGIGLWFAPA